MSDHSHNSNSEYPILIYANPGWLWIFWAPQMAVQLPFMLQVGLSHPGVILYLTIFFCTLVGTTVRMVHEPHIAITDSTLFIRHLFGQEEVSLHDIVAWGLTWGGNWGSFYVRLSGGRKVTATLSAYLDQADRDRLITVLSQQRITRE